MAEENTSEKPSSISSIHIGKLLGSIVLGLVSGWISALILLAFLTKGHM